jgi:hypothetical protein
MNTDVRDIRRINMMNFRDMTFCPFHEQCHLPCERALTNEVRKKAEELGEPVDVFQWAPYMQIKKEV